MTETTAAVDLQPLEDRVAIRPDKPVTETVGGVILPDAAQETPNEGIVVAVGPQTSLVRGDRVVFPRYAGAEIEVDGETLVVLRETDVIATRKPKSALVGA